MRRLLRNLLCGSCAFLCAGFVAMWVRSHLLEPEGVTWAARDDSARSVGVIALSSAGGCVGVRRAWSKGPGLPPEQWVELMGDFDAGWRFDEEVDPRPNDPKTFRYYRNGHYHAGFGWGSRRVVFGRDLFGGEWFVAAPY